MKLCNELKLERAIKIKISDRTDRTGGAATAGPGGKEGVRDSIYSLFLTACLMDEELT